MCYKKKHNLKEFEAVFKIALRIFLFISQAIFNLVSRRARLCICAYNGFVMKSKSIESWKTVDGEVFLNFN